MLHYNFLIKKMPLLEFSPGLFWQGIQQDSSVMKFAVTIGEVLGLLLSNSIPL